MPLMGDQREADDLNDERPEYNSIRSYRRCTPQITSIFKDNATQRQRKTVVYGVLSHWWIMTRKRRAYIDRIDIFSQRHDRLRPERRERGGRVRGRNGFFRASRDTLWIKRFRIFIPSRFSQREVITCCTSKDDASPQTIGRIIRGYKICYCRHGDSFHGSLT